MPTCSVLGIAAHPDDLEILALPAILEARQRGGGFGAVVIASGGDPKRLQEQRRAAEIGAYDFVRLLGYSSAELKGERQAEAVEDLRCLIGDLQPSEIWTHDLADPHATHVAAALAVIAAIKALPPPARPQRLLGCEIWRSLAWLARVDRVLLPLEDIESLSDRLLQCHASQVAQRPYDQGARGRRVANAVFDDHQVPPPKELAYAMDLTPLILEGGPTPSAFMQAAIARFQNEVLGGIERCLNQ